MNQLALFENPSIDITIDELMFKLNPSIVYEKLKADGLRTAEAVYQIILHEGVFDFRMLWDEFESYGKMTYSDFQVYNYNIQIVDFMNDIFFNNNIIYTWKEDDIFDNRMAVKIKRKIREHLYKNERQIESLLTPCSK